MLFLDDLRDSLFILEDFIRQFIGNTHIIYMLSLFTTSRLIHWHALLKGWRTHV